MATTVSSDVKLQVGRLRQAPAPRVPAAEITEIVESVLATLSGEITAADLKMYKEIEALSHFIQNARSEIAAVRPDRINQQDIPKATDELDAVVGATEAATGTILDTCEALERLSARVSPDVAEDITQSVTRIYEACNFQDITGQRINKVVKTLKQIEERVDAMLNAFGPTLAELPAGDDQPSDGLSADAKLLHGPQLPEEAKRQAEIDAILASFG